MAQKGIGVSNLPNVKYRSFCKAGIDFNIMTVGSNGLGKSSFINQMLGDSILSSDPFLKPEDGHHSNETVRALDEDIVDDPESKYFHRNSLINIQISKFFVMENDFQTRVTVTEVDGVGDGVCNEGCWDPIVELIQDNFRDYLDQERKNVRSLIKDKRIHICLYFLEPNPSHVSLVDIRTMKEISKICNLIPVVGKSDLLSDSEREECRNRIVEVLSMENIDVFRLDILEKEKISRTESPFFIIAKNVNSGDSSGHNREYPWGTMFPEKVESNDFYFLVDSLIAKNLIRLVETTEVFYDEYKTREIGLSIASKPGALGEDDRRLTKEIQKKIKEDERTIVELRQKLIEKRKYYESKMLEITSKYSNEKINSS
ncbi:SEPTIN HOMOLOG [Encephalitozoon cuniculi GB-M1]|uniref:Cell division control protein 3 n=2 Tax=Encephalitozoon cuniculi TaxID=6035 RepID=CDC3_ENCCU|nr:septin [Encephalitozoon cuniculi GB-M1]Q8SSI8.1 RecName: Full=Cell division control protein 3 [Encephalitozoon cuniculi GB-M1]AGE96045.1 septin-like protein [Encephalitozoon cuniculi]KMV66793.1 septin [Encephalitozoon cuniculi EcunIII-L]UYI28511.1 Cdc3-like septin [Encephalitozoon cuniculi]CAD25010.1 SEPTIN HOMOLOG [Encephalitozoon cuniculi GB-M1]